MHIELSDAQDLRLREIREALDGFKTEVGEIADDLELEEPDDERWEGTADQTHLHEMIGFLRDASDYLDNAERAIGDAQGD